MGWERDRTWLYNDSCPVYPFHEYVGDDPLRQTVQVPSDQRVQVDPSWPGEAIGLGKDQA